jgi:hypothetical protein
MNAPIMDDREAMHRERSKRYAEAIAAAAAADERVKALTEKLEEAEYLRRIAEDEAAAAQWINDDSGEPWRSNVDTHVYHAGEPEPPDDREFVFSLSDGTIYRALRGRKTEHNPQPSRYGWQQVGYHPYTQSDWLAVLEHAPLLAFTAETDWGLDRIVRDVTRHVEQETELRRRLPRDPDATSYNQDDLPRRLTVYETQHTDQLARCMRERDEAIDEAAKLHQLHDIRACLGAGPMDYEAFVDEVDRIIGFGGAA